MKVLMNYSGNRGYSADQIENPTTLSELLAQVQDAITEWGEDAEVVLFQTNNGHGANFGQLHEHPMFESAEELCYECGGEGCADCEDIRV